MVCASWIPVVSQNRNRLCPSPYVMIIGSSPHCSEFIWAVVNGRRNCGRQAIWEIVGCRTQAHYVKLAWRGEGLEEGLPADMNLSHPLPHLWRHLWEPQDFEKPCLKTPVHDIMEFCDLWRKSWIEKGPWSQSYGRFMSNVNQSFPESPKSSSLVLRRWACYPSPLSFVLTCLQVITNF